MWILSSVYYPLLIKSKAAINISRKEVYLISFIVSFAMGVIMAIAQDLLEIRTFSMYWFLFYIMIFLVSLVAFFTKYRSTSGS
jgi:hypothetical protein